MLIELMILRIYVSSYQGILVLEYLILVSVLGATAGMLMVWSLFSEGTIVVGVILVRGHVVPTMLKVPIGIHLCPTMIVMENPNHLNDPNVPEGDQAPAAPDGFAPQWIGEHDPNNNNGWIEWDVPLGGEVDEPMVDPEVNEDVMDDDDWEDDVEWLMAPVTPPRATMTVSSTYEVRGPSTVEIEGSSSPLPAPGLPVPPTMIEDLSTRLGNLEYKHGVLMRKMEEASDAEVADNITIGEIQPRVATVEEHVQVMESRTVHVVSGLKEIESRVQQLRTRVAEMESHVGILMSYMLWMEERLTFLEKRLPGPPPGP
nr:hypothetical protein [Tanacetum cinerariifolium]